MSPMPAIMWAWSSEPLTDHNTAPKAFQAGIGADPHIQYITDAWSGKGCQEMRCCMQGALNGMLWQPD